MIIPNIWENKKMFQTTNQFLFPTMKRTFSPPVRFPRAGLVGLVDLVNVAKAKVQRRPREVAFSARCECWFTTPTCHGYPIYNDNNDDNYIIWYNNLWYIRDITDIWDFSIFIAKYTGIKTYDIYIIYMR